MPTVKFSKEDIIRVSYDITRNEGFDAVSARRIAKELNSSVQPIFSNYASMDELKEALLEKVTEDFYKAINRKYDNSMPNKYQAFMNYINFAKNEPKLFQLLVMSDKAILFDKFSDGEVSTFSTKMWLFTHGLATLVSANSCILNDEQIAQLLKSEHEALRLLEKNEFLA